MRRPLARRAPARAFTLIELLVVIAIIGVLIALLLPAVQQAREAARRIQCTNNLKQLGIAAHNYLDTNACFPLGGYYNNASPAMGWDKGFLVGLAPYIEQSNVFNAFNAGLRYTHASNTTVLAAQIGTLHCPSDPRIAARVVTGPPVAGWNVGRTSYRGICGPWTNPPARANPALDPNYAQYRANALGALYPYSSTTVADIQDGTSHTLLVGESSVARLSEQDYWYYHWWMAGNYADTLQNAMYPPNPGSKGSDILFNGSQSTALFLVSASSEHPGGVNFLFCDGSVRFLKNTIDSWPLDPSRNYAPSGVTQTVLNPPYGVFALKPGARFGVYQALSTRAGGEVISADAY